MLSLQQYRPVLSLPGAKALLGWSLLNRVINIPIGAITLIIAYGAAGSWLYAGLAAALCTLGAALAAWIYGKLMDRFSVRQTLLISAPGALSLLGLSLLAEGNLETCIWAAAAGLTRPASGAGIRSIWASLTENNDPQIRSSAYALESSLVPAAGAIGAAGAGLLSAVMGPQLIGVPVTFITLAATLGLANCKAAKHCQNKQQQQKPKNKPGLSAGSWAALLGIGAAWASLSCIELGIGASRGTEQLGLLSAVGFISVIIGAHLFSSYSQALAPLKWISLGLAASSGAALLLATPGAAVTLIIAGMILTGASRGMVSPAASTALADYTPHSRQSEAMGLYGSVVLLGQAAGRPLAGLLSQSSPNLPLIAGAAISLLAAAAIITIQVKRVSAATS